MSQVTDKLIADVAAQKTVIESAVTAIKGFPQVVADAVQKALTDAGVNGAATEAAVTQATTDIEASTQELTDALTIGTPTPALPVEPAPAPVASDTPTV